MVILYDSSHTLTDFLELKSNAKSKSRNIAARDYLVLADFADS